jgi:peptidoglycan/LPS O-acetylase OafA/YrhL
VARSIPSPIRSKRKTVIDLVRFFSIFVVLGCHFYPRWIANSADYPQWLRWFIQTLFLNGTNGVTCFFVVSGFLITQLMAESAPRFLNLDLRDFYVKRAARIAPLLILIVLVGVLLSQGNFGVDERMRRYGFFDVPTGFTWDFWLSLSTFTFNLFLVLKGLSGKIGLHWAVLWSLAVEEQFYFFYPLCFKRIGGKRALCFFLAAVALSAPLFRALVDGLWGDSVAWGRNFSLGVFDALAIGCLAYWAWPAFKRWTGRRPFLAVGGLVLGVFLLAVGYAGLGLSDWVEFVFGPTFVAIGCALVLLSGLEMKTFEKPFWKWLSRPGRLSYGGYLWHVTILYFVMPLVVPWGGLPALFGWMLVVWIWCSLSYRWFEQPMNRRVRSWFKIGPSSTLE